MRDFDEQVKRLRGAARSYGPYVPDYVNGLLWDAANAIEALSARPGRKGSGEIRNGGCLPLLE